MSSEISPEPPVGARVTDGEGGVWHHKHAECWMERSGAWASWERINRIPPVTVVGEVSGQESLFGEVAS